MLAIRAHQQGGPEVLRLETVPDLPAPDPGEVLVRLETSGVNPVDTYRRAGTAGYQVALPWTPGLDGAGRIEAVGAGVIRFHPGQRVYVAGSLTGTAAQSCLCRETQVHPLPLAVSFEEGACLGVPAATAWRALADIARAKPGETVLIHGASGGVGLAAVQIAVAARLFVIGTASTAAGREAVLAAGARACLDHADPAHLAEAARIASGGLDPAAGRGLDIIVEMRADLNLGADLKALARGGRVVVVGSRGSVAVNPRDLMARDASVLGLSLFNAPPEALARIHAGLGAMLTRGELRPVVARSFALADIGAAHAAVMEPGARGNIVLTIPR